MEPVTNWEERYASNNTRWDLGAISEPLKAYFNQLTNNSLKILIPGVGNGYEAEYLHQNGFKNVYILDIAPTPLHNFQLRNPTFPSTNIIQENFFEHQSYYDLVVEQTFFCAINPKHRAAYAKKVAELLNKNGKLVGLLWSVPLNDFHPPFGGSKNEYHQYFDSHFDYLHFSDAYNSIVPRQGRELFILAQKKSA